MPPIKKSVVMFEVFKLGLMALLLSAIFAGRINPRLGGKVLGVAGLTYGAYFFYRAGYQKEHSSLLLRLRGDDRKIPTTRLHRATMMILAAGLIACGLALLHIAR